MCNIRSIHNFNKKYFFISQNSFSQHVIIRKELRFYITLLLSNYLNTIKKSNIVCIGGESYLFGMSNKFNHIIHYTNSKYIYNDALLNNNIYKKKLENYYINYNTFKKIKNGDILIINSAKLNINILEQCNNRFYKFIIIINCHHDEFWKRISILSNYKLMCRKQFIVTNYFVTVTLFQYTKEIPIYISLGNTCAIAYQLKNVGLRNELFPFDWCKVSLKQINKVLENKFTNYSNIHIYKYSNNHKMLQNDSGSYLLKNSYNILFAHELYSISLSNIAFLKNKLDQRILNFKKLQNKNIRFVIQNNYINIKEINLLIQNLKEYFTHFVLIYITDHNQNITKIDQLNFDKKIIKIITIDYNIIDWKDWKYSNINWFDIFFANFENYSIVYE